MSKTSPFSHGRIIHLQNAEEGNHFDMHEDITETREHLIEEHHVTPVVGQYASGQGPAAALAGQHEALHQGALPVVASTGFDSRAINQHLVQEHGVTMKYSGLSPFLAHAMAHVHGDAVPGHEHYHESGT